MTTRLNVNINAETSAALREIGASQGVSITEAVRRAVSMWKFLSDEQDKGNRVMVVEGEGSDVHYRELVIL